ncbi:MAG: YjbQ family protein [Candidatus Marinimicrobia bacterium]|nr:YjbQ family protein [Candidatus Neomarinimicrobiota bacterium]
MIKLSIPTHRRIDFVDITSQVQREVASSGVIEGTIMIYVPHTTCGIIINESADPHVVEDIPMQLAKLVPYEAEYS